MSAIHRLKTIQPFLNYVWDGAKTFEVRYDDRGFTPGDLLILIEWDDATGWGPRHCARRVQFILTGDQYGIAKGFAVMGFYPEDIGWNWTAEVGQ